MLSAYERRVLSELEQQLTAESTIRRARRRAVLKTAGLLLSSALLVAVAVAGIARLLPQALSLVGLAWLGLVVGWQLGRRRTGWLAVRLCRLRRWVHRHP